MYDALCAYSVIVYSCGENWDGFGGYDVCLCRCLSSVKGIRGREREERESARTSTIQKCQGGKSGVQGYIGRRDRKRVQVLSCKGDKSYIKYIKYIKHMNYILKLQGYVMIGKGLAWDSLGFTGVSLGFGRDSLWDSLG